jgi:transglutaminase-like putative cysteine protease
MSVRRYSIRHRTTYEYEGEVVHAHQLLHLAPRTVDRQSVLRHVIDIDPAPTLRTEGVDPFGNPLTRLEFDRPHKRLAVAAELDLELRPRPEPTDEEADGWQTTRASLAYGARPLDADMLEAWRFRLQSPYVRLKTAFGGYAEDCFPPGATTLAGARALSAKIHADFAYAPGATTIATPLADVLEKRRGVCQDFAHVMIACLRSLGLAARYVSGYLRTTPRPDAAPLVGADTSHAWVSVWCPPLGWVDLDPTNGVVVDGDHVTIAWGRDFGDVSPLRGVLFGGGRHSVAVEVSTRFVGP